ncbi:MAG: three-Cys-motif partner protein TcmP [Dehalococcoidales bacterium]|nr:three-Cys-motif partner protein TcmP [Dehalococcoidales bacterium]
MNAGLKQIPRPPPKWLCHKLQCFAEFIKIYTDRNSKHYYLDIFAGSPFYPCKTNNCTIDVTEISALKNNFLKCIFIVNNSEEAESLASSTESYKKRRQIITGNCINNNVMRQAFDFIPRSKSILTLIDPVGYTRLRWTTVKKLAAYGTDWKGHKTDLLIFFPLEMALLRNLTRVDCEASIDRLYGNSDWRNIRQDRLDEKIDHFEAGKALINLYKKGLKELDYKYIDDLPPALFSNPPVYHIIWAGDSANRKTELDNIWNSPSFLPCELFGKNLQE